MVISYSVKVSGSQKVFCRHDVTDLFDICVTDQAVLGRHRRRGDGRVAIRADAPEAKHEEDHQGGHTG